MKSFFWNKHTKLIAKHLAGWLLILIGIVGGFIPILQGWVFILAGVFLLADHIPLFGKLRDYLQKRFPKAAAYVHKKRNQLQERHPSKEKDNE